MNASLWTPLALGLLGGLHCAGMCGPLVLALAPRGRSRWHFIAGRVAYQGGRIATYCILGLALGGAGSAFHWAGLQQALSIALGVGLLIAWFIVPRWIQSGWTLPWVGALRSGTRSLLKQKHLPAMTALGALNGFLPCGLVYVAGAEAMSAGGTLWGAASMAMFGLGTLPVMLGLSLSGHLISARMRTAFRGILPVTVAVVAILMILRGSGLGIPYLSPAIGSSDVPSCHE